MLKHRQVQEAIRNSLDESFDLFETSVAVTLVAAFCLLGTIRHSIPPQTMAAIQLRPEIKHNLAAQRMAARYEQRMTLTNQIATKAKKKEPWKEFAAKTLIRSGRELVPFVPYDYQVQLVEQIEKHYGTVAIKTRQMGFTELVASYFLWQAKDDPGFLAVIFSKNADDTKNIARRVRVMSVSHPSIELETENLHDLKLKNGGRLVFKPSTTNAARGLESVSAILFDEAAFVPEIEEIYSSALPSTEMLGEAAKVIILSTPNGQSGFYWDRVAEMNGDINVLELCQKVRDGEVDPIQTWTDAAGWCKFLVHWKAHPIYRDRPNYLLEQKNTKRLTEAQVQREYNLSFTEGTAQVFPHQYIDAAECGSWQAPVGSLYRPSYIMGIDPSFGGEDYFTVQVYKVDSKPYQLVAEFREHLKTKDYYIAHAIDLIDAYKPQYVACEMNGGGSLILQELVEKRPSTAMKEVRTTNQSKIVNTDRLTLMLERGELEMPVGCALAEEMRQFIEITNRTSTVRIRSAPSGKNDDAVMACAIAFAWIDELGAAPTLNDYLAAW